MKTFLTEILFVITGSLICILYIIFPNPYLMAAFIFIAQPLFLFAIASTIYMILVDLKRKKVL